MVKVYTKNFCPYCVKAKSLLGSLGVQFEEIDVTNNIDLLVEISEKSGFKTVPQIFVGDKCLGGFTDIEALHNEGKLMDELKA